MSEIEFSGDVFSIEVEPWENWHGGRTEPLTVPGWAGRARKAAQLPDEAVLAAIRAINGPNAADGIEPWGGCQWAMTWDLCRAFPDTPDKVVEAKLTRLMNRGLIGGCDCGCRGDFTITPDGVALLKSAEVSAILRA